MTQAQVFPDRSAPVFYVKIFPESGKGERVDVTERVLAMTYDDDEKAANKLELDLDNFDLAILDDPMWRKGNRLEVSWGYAANIALPRECVIQRIKGNTVIKIEALAKSILMNKQPRSRVFEHAKRSEIVATIAKENGYGPDLQQIEDTELVIEHTVQAKMTDAVFLKHLAEKEGFQFFVDFDGLHFHRRRIDQKPTRTFVYYSDPGAGDILSWNLDNDITNKPGAVTAVGRDPLKKVDIKERADNATPRATLGEILEAVDKQTGEKTLQVQTATEATILTNAPNAPAAKREAVGRFVLTQQATVLLSLSCVGDPRVAAKQIVEVKNLSKRLSGKYYVKNVKHKLSNSEYTMDLKMKSDGSHGHGGTGAAKSDGQLNTKAPADPNALVPVEIIDGRTGEIKTVYKRGGA